MTYRSGRRHTPRLGQITHTAFNVASAPASAASISGTACRNTTVEDNLRPDRRRVLIPFRNREHLSGRSPTYVRTAASAIIISGVGDGNISCPPGDIPTAILHELAPKASPNLYYIFTTLFAPAPPARNEGRRATHQGPPLTPFPRGSISRPSGRGCEADAGRVSGVRGGGRSLWHSAKASEARTPHSNCRRSPPPSRAAARPCASPCAGPPQLEHDHPCIRALRLFKSCAVSRQVRKQTPQFRDFRSPERGVG
jgi:hypothetical protein